MKLLCALVLLPWGSSALAQAASRPDSISEVQLSTSATRTVPPDLAILRIGIMTDRERATEASRANARVAAAVRDTLRAIEIPLDSLSMSSYTVRPRQNREQRTIGYTARTELNVAMRDLAGLGEAIDAALGAGATDVSPLNFVATSTDAARDSAYVEAVRAIYRQAATIVEAAGGRLIGSARLTVGERRARVPCATCIESVSREPTAVLPGLVAITVTINGTFRFLAKPGGAFPAGPGLLDNRPPQPSKSHRVVGWVLADRTGRPLEGAQIIVDSAGLTTLTDEYGRYLLDGLPEGNVEIRVRRIGFHPERRTLWRPSPFAVDTLNFWMRGQWIPGPER